MAKPNYNAKLVFNAADASSEQSGSVDTIGYNWVAFDFLGAAPATKATTWKIQEADAAGGPWSDIPALVGDGEGGFTIPDPSGADYTGRLEVDLLGRKRHLQAVYQGSTTDAMLCVARLDMPSLSEVTEQGVHVVARA